MLGLPMKPSAMITIFLAVVAVVVAAVFATGGNDDKAKPGSQGRGGTVSAPAGSQRLSFVISPEKEDLLKAVVAKFNASQTQVGGKRVFVSMTAMNSGDAENAI